MGTRERREREKQQRREAILDAARRLFWERGYERATMPQIAETAELAPGTLYLYFQNKQALYAELLIEGYERLAEHLRQAIQGDASPRQQADALVDAFLGFAREHPEYFDIIFFVVQREGRALAELALDAEQRNALSVAEGACRRVATEVLERAGVPGEAAPSRVQAVWSMLAGVVLYFVRDDAATFSAVASEAKGLILRGAFKL
ncbi:MAG TPA: helix-turn-helix domain-containing protein [Planctomycetota bacterium]|nr:helix-turn-helix domain-containing protein [Planctomycetota bacterium]